MIKELRCANDLSAPRSWDPNDSHGSDITTSGFFWVVGPTDPMKGAIRPILTRAACPVGRSEMPRSVPMGEVVEWLELASQESERLLVSPAPAFSCHYPRLAHPSEAEPSK
jgi:hypothetical protein